MRCGNCTHFAESAMEAMKPPANGRPVVGVCRRYPPRLMWTDGCFPESLFPGVHRSQACGEFQDERAGGPLC